MNSTNATYANRQPTGTYRRQSRSNRICMPTFNFARNVPITLVDLGIVLVWAALITAIVV